MNTATAENKIMYVMNACNLSAIAGSPIAYWVSDTIINLYKQNKLTKEVVVTKQGLKSSDDKRFFRYWTEVEFAKIDFHTVGMKWVPLNKGGNKKWYGDNWYVVNWENDGEEIKAFAKKLYNSVTRTITSIDYYFKDCISWAQITSTPSFRYIPKGFIFNAAGPSLFVNNADNMFYMLGLLNTKIVLSLTQVLNPTLNVCVTDMLNLPYMYRESVKSNCSAIVEDNILIAKNDWDSFETSWDFKKHPLI